MKRFIFVILFLSFFSVSYPMTPEVMGELSKRVDSLEQNSTASSWDFSAPIKTTLSLVRLLDPRAFLGGGGLLLYF